MKLLHLLAGLTLALRALTAGPVFEGNVSATLTRGAGNQSRLEFTRKGNLLRIEDTASKLQPVNLLDLASNKLTILYPHNSSYAVADLSRLHSLGESAAAPVPGGPAVGPAGMRMPPIPPMPGLSGPTELAKTEQTKKILGFDCTLYLIESRNEKFEIWATPDSNLFPFYLIELAAAARRFGPPMLEEQWIELLRAKSLFPLEATLHREDDAKTEQLSFKVDQIVKRTIDNESLFKPPENYQRVDTP